MEPLYQKEHWVYSKTINSDCKTGVRILIEWHTTLDSRKELLVRITDETDLSFLFSLRLTEEGFQQLKAQQGVLVDFIAFSQRLTDLLKLCKEEESNNSPKYILQFNQHEEVGSTLWLLQVIETNPFKHLTHLALKFQPGNDKDMRNYLSQCLKQMKEENINLRHTLEKTKTNLNNKLNAIQKAFTDRTLELEQLKAETLAKTDELSQRFQQQLFIEKEKYHEAQTLSQQKFAEEKSDFEKTHSKIIQSLETKVQDLMLTNKKFSEENHRLETELKECRYVLDTNEEQSHKRKQELQTCRKQLDESESQLRDLEHNYHKLQAKMLIVEEDWKESEMKLSKSQELYNSELAQKKLLQEECESKKKHIEKMERSLRSYSSELSKGNEIIKKLQSEIKEYHQKVKMRTQITTEQEKVIEEKEKELEVVREDLRLTNSLLQSSQSEVEALQNKVEVTSKKLNEAKQLLKSNENVISWLNKQITEQTQRPKSTFPTGSANLSPNTLPVVYRPHTTNLPTVTNIPQSSSESPNLGTASPLLSEGTKPSKTPSPFTKPALRPLPLPTSESVDQRYLPSTVHAKAAQDQSLTSSYFPQTLQSTKNH